MCTRHMWSVLQLYNSLFVSNDMIVYSQITHKLSEVGKMLSEWVGKASSVMRRHLLASERSEQDTYRGNTIENWGCLFIYLFVYMYGRT